MNRTVRNGLAVATMAGGIFLLGQAVASADDTTGSSEAVGGPAVTVVDGSTSADGGEAVGHEVYSDNHQDASGGSNAGAVSSGNEVHVENGSGESSDTGNPTVDSGGNSVTNTGANGGTTSNSTSVSGDTSADGGTATGGDVSGSSESVGGGSSSGGGGESDLASSSGSGSGASTTVDGSGSADGGYAAGHYVESANEQYATGGTNAGAVESGNAVVVVCFNWKSTNTCNPVVSSGGNSITNTGANGGTASNSTTVSGNTSANGGTASSGGTSGSSESVDLSGFFEWLSGHLSGSAVMDDEDWWEYIGGASTWVDGSTSADGGEAYGHGVGSHNYQDVSGGQNYAVIETGNEVHVYCFNWKSDDVCNPHVSSGGNSISNNGANGGSASNGVHVGGDTSADGGRTMGGSTSGSSESVGGTGSGATTVVDGSQSADGGYAEGHTVWVDSTQYATGGTNEGYIASGNKVVVYCFNWKSTNSCNPVVTSGDNHIVNTGANGGTATNVVVVCGATSANGGGAAHQGNGCPVATQPTTPTHPTTPTTPTHPTTPAQPEHPATVAPAAPVAAVQHVAPVVSGSGSHVTTVSAAHSSPATLAYTGADVFDALGLGLLALTGGLGLALAGRRRSAA